MNDFMVGLPVGDEEFKDVNLTSDGFMAGGIRDNKGEGGDDVFITHFDHNGAVVLEETMGGVTDDRFNAFWLRDDLESGHFAGYDKEYGLDESGNAYVGGIVLNGFLQSNGSCKIPRVLLVDDIFDINGATLTNNIHNSSDRVAIRQFLQNRKIDLALLYDVDVVLKEIRSGASGVSSNDLDTAMNDLDYLLTSLMSNNIKVGLITGYDRSKINFLSDFMDMTFQLNQMNYNNAGKLHFMMLEHEMWVPSAVEDLTGNINTSNIDAHYDVLKQDHYTLLDHMNTRKGQSGNVWATLDYMNHFWNTEANGTNDSRSDVVSRQAHTVQCENKSDYMLLVYYLNNQFSNGTDWFGGLDWQIRIDDLGSNSASNIIPLFSAEYFRTQQDMCGEDPTTDYLGKFLDGPPANPTTYVGNDFNLVENDHLSKYMLEPVTHKNNIFISAFGWFKYTCVKDKNFLDDSKVACGSYGGNALEEAENNLARIEFYPNPTTGLVKVEGLQDEAKVDIHDISGKIIETLSIGSNSAFSIQHLQNGIYFCKTRSGGNYYTNKIIKQ